MALTIRPLSSGGGSMLADRRLYLDSSREQLCEEGAASAAYLFAAPGSPIPDAEAARLGLVMVDGRVVQKSAEPEPEPVKPEPPPNVEHTTEAASATEPKPARKPKNGK